MTDQIPSLIKAANNLPSNPTEYTYPLSFFGTGYMKYEKNMFRDFWPALATDLSALINNLTVDNYISVCKKHGLLALDVLTTSKILEIFNKSESISISEAQKTGLTNYILISESYLPFLLVAITTPRLASYNTCNYDRSNS